MYKGKWRGTAVAISTCDSVTSNPNSEQLLYTSLTGEIDKKTLDDFENEARLMKNLRPHNNVGES